MGNILNNLSDYNVFRRVYNSVRNSAIQYPDLSIPAVYFENKDISSTEMSNNVQEKVCVENNTTPNPKGKNRKSIYNAPKKENWSITSTIIHRNKLYRDGFDKLKTRRTMNAVLRDISNVKVRLKKVPKSPGGRPIRLRPIPDSSNELGAILKKRYACMHSPESQIFIRK